MGGVIVETIAKDAAENAAKKAAEEAAKRAAEAAAKKAAEDAAKKAAEDAAKKAAEDAAKKAAEDAAKKAAEDAAKKAAEDAAKKAADDAAKKAAEDASKKAAEDATKKGAEDATKKAAEDATKKAAEDAGKKSVVRTIGAGTRDALIGGSKVLKEIPLLGTAFNTAGRIVGIGGGAGILYEFYKYATGGSSKPEKPEGATQIKGPDGKMHDVRPITPDEAKTRNPADFAKDQNGNPAKDQNGNPYVYYDPKDPNETFHEHGFVDTAIKWLANLEKNPSIAPFAPYINMGVAALATGFLGSLLNPALGLVMGLAVAAIMYFKGNDFIKQRAADIESHDQWTTKHYFNPSSQGTNTNTNNNTTPDPTPSVTTGNNKPNPQIVPK